MSSGRVWKFGNDVTTDVLAPGIYIKLPIEELASHCLETVDSKFSGSVIPGDYVVGGKNFGMGSSREQAAQVLKILGVTAVLAPSFGGIFYRNAFNLGLPAIILPNTDRIDDGQNLDIDLHAGKISNLSTGEELIGEAVPKNLLAIVEAGGLVPFLETKFKQNDN